MGNCNSSNAAANSGAHAYPEAARVAAKPSTPLEKEVKEMPVKDLKQELRSRGIPTDGMLEKEDLEDAVVKARLREAPNTPATSTGSSSSTAGSPQNAKPSSLKKNNKTPPPTKRNYEKPLPIRRKPDNKKVSKSSAQPAYKASHRTPAKVDYSKWKFDEKRFNGSASYTSLGKQEKVKGPVSEAKELIRNEPEKYVALTFQSDMVDWPVGQQQYTLIHREGTEGYEPAGLSNNGDFTVIHARYQRCPPFANNELPKKYRDEYTDNMSYQGYKLHHDKNKPAMPGRGMGVADAPNTKIIGDVDPSDIHQGTVGDCWLLSAIAALAEFDGAVKRLFRKTPNLHKMPLDGPNKYIITLYDLTTWQEVDVVVDERLCMQANGSGLLGAKPSEDGELWVCYLEKALAAHCGGWDKITGGQCTHGWALLTGCKYQYTIRLNPKTGKYACYGKYNPSTKQWAKHANSPHDGEQSIWKMPWPAVGGGGTDELTQEELFTRMCAWDDENFIVGASVDGVSDKVTTDGMVNNHAYSVIEAHNDVAGTDIDLFKVRNPWGSGEIENGEFDDDGPGWDRYPQIKRKLKPVVADDGIFYLTKKEFFHHFSTIYLSASNMTEFLED